MDRRGFIGWLSSLVAVPFIAKCESVTDVVGATVVVPEVSTIPVSREDKQFQYVQAQKDLNTGDFVFRSDGQIYGVAINEITKGHFGFIQVSNIARTNYVITR